MPTLWPVLGSGPPVAGPLRRVELKILLEFRDLGSLRIPAHRLEHRQVFFLDTADLDAHRQGVLMRLRLSGRGAELVLKRREPADRPSPTGDRHPERRIELDVMPAACLRAVSLARPLAASALRAVLRHRRQPATLLSRDQRELLRAWIPTLRLTGLAVHGPVRSCRAPLTRHTSLETWSHPARPPVLELSGKCRPTRVPRLVADLNRLVVVHGLIPSTTQLTKAEWFLRPGTALTPREWQSVL